MMDAFVLSLAANVALLAALGFILTRRQHSSIDAMLIAILVAFIPYYVAIAISLLSRTPFATQHDLVIAAIVVAMFVAACALYIEFAKGVRNVRAARICGVVLTLVATCFAWVIHYDVLLTRNIDAVPSQLSIDSVVQDDDLVELPEVFFDHIFFLSSEGDDERRRGVYTSFATFVVRSPKLGHYEEFCWTLSPKSAYKNLKFKALGLRGAYLVAPPRRSSGRVRELYRLDAFTTRGLPRSIKVNVDRETRPGERIYLVVRVDATESHSPKDVFAGVTEERSCG